MAYLIIICTKINGGICWKFFEGICQGSILSERRGSSGFGYDPVFVDIASGKTLAEMSLAEKNRTSHRYRALIEMRELMLRLGLARETGSHATGR